MEFWFARLASIWLALAVLVGSAMPAQAQNGESRRPVDVCIARATPGSTVRDVLAGRVAADCAVAQHQLGSGDFWVVSQPIRPTSKVLPHYHVRWGSVWQNGVTLYALFDDGKLVRMHASSRALTRQIQLGAIVDFELPPTSHRLLRLAWHVEKSGNMRGVLLSPEIVSGGEHDRWNLQMAGLYGAFGGLALALLVYNIALWSAMRQRFQLAYCAMVIALAAYAFSSSAALAWAFPGIDNNDRLRFNFVSLAMTAMFVVVFARSFLEKRVFAGWVGRATSFAIVILGAAGIGFWALSYVDVRLADRFYAVTILIGLMIAPPMIWRAWTARSDYRWLFAVAWGVPIVFAVGRVLAMIHVVPGGFWLDNSTILSMTLESLISSLAIAYRVQLLRAERDDARAGEVVARQLADIEPLTGLLNRRAFLTQATGRAGPQTLHIIDIDHFKQINETLGHDGGDEVLRVYARVLRTLLPVGALIARIGGEEFAVVTDAATPIDPERILAKLRAARMPFDLAVTSSIGSCTGPLTSEIDWKKMYHNADRALFDAKSAGRDRARAARPLAA